MYDCATVLLGRSTSEKSALFDAIPHRHTNRVAYDSRPVATPSSPRWRKPRTSHWCGTTQPINQIEERIDRERSVDLKPEFTSALVPPGGHAVFSFRVGYPTRAALRSPRRQAEEVSRGNAVGGW
ncbi:hypothetical protein LWC34_52150 [Kibdelosporangium philippinense]|uniref:Uncharacterized protein n=1 Tax=Kibdelosporangium philippinense TaxID=211113 RepID=A0ABS8ZVM4_9PSEU|nr:hypothetical protein [Kibdelosporangium philippinense]MCE7011308.1 hypothetical protein [Kibdelosporangium philippinense]